MILISLRYHHDNQVLAPYPFRNFEGLFEVPFCTSGIRPLKTLSESIQIILGGLLTGLFNKSPQITSSFKKFGWPFDWPFQKGPLNVHSEYSQNFEGPFEGNLTIILSFNLRKAPQNCPIEVILKLI